MFQNSNPASFSSKELVNRRCSKKTPYDCTPALIARLGCFAAKGRLLSLTFFALVSQTTERKHKMNGKNMIAYVLNADELLRRPYLEPLCERFSAMLSGIINCFSAA